jgi:hypothetical protein
MSFRDPWSLLSAKTPSFGKIGHTSKQTTLHPRLLLLFNHELDTENLLQQSARASGVEGSLHEASESQTDP